MLIWLYITLLKLYPAAYYNQFADEMVAIFRQLLDERPPNDIWLPAREIVSLLTGIIRERQRENNQMDTAPFWQKFTVLLLPMLLGLGILAFRPVHYFYLSDKAWLLFGAIGLAIMLMGWLRDGRLTALALPSIGFMFFIAERLFSQLPSPGYYIPMEVWTAAPCLLLLAVLIGWSDKQLPWKSWLLPVLAALIIPPVLGLIAAYFGSTFAPIPSLEELVRNYLFGAVLPIGRLALIILVGLPFAYRFGSKAVLVLLGYLFFDLFGLSGSLPYDEMQRTLGAVYVVLFLLVTPIFTVQVVEPRWERVGILGLMILAYLLAILAVGFSENFDPIFTIYRFNELLLTLLSLYLALSIYALLQRKSKPFPPAESDLDDGAELVSEGYR